jgi:hypothetical protein
VAIQGPTFPWIDSRRSQSRIRLPANRVPLQVIENSPRTAGNCIWNLLRLAWILLRRIWILLRRILILLRSALISLRETYPSG